MTPHAAAAIAMILIIFIILLMLVIRSGLEKRKLTSIRANKKRLEANLKIASPKAKIYQQRHITASLSQSR